MTDEELIARLRGDDTDFWHCEAADRIEALVKEQNYWIERCGRERAFASSHRVRAERLEAAIDYILDGMAIDAPDYEIDPDDDFLDAANSDWVRDVLTRLAAAIKGADHD